MIFVVKLKKTSTETFHLLRDLHGGDGRCTYCTLPAGLRGMLLGVYGCFRFWSVSVSTKKTQAKRKIHLTL